MPFKLINPFAHALPLYLYWSLQGLSRCCTHDPGLDFDASRQQANSCGKMPAKARSPHDVAGCSSPVPVLHSGNLCSQHKKICPADCSLPCKPEAKLGDPAD